MVGRSVPTACFGRPTRLSRCCSVDLSHTPQAKRPLFAAIDCRDVTPGSPCGALDRFKRRDPLTLPLSESFCERSNFSTVGSLSGSAHASDHFFFTLCLDPLADTTALPSKTLSRKSSPAGASKRYTPSLSNLTKASPE